MAACDAGQFRLRAREEVQNDHVHMQCACGHQSRDTLVQTPVCGTLAPPVAPALFHVDV
jgi:hypothetical protein